MFTLAVGTVGIRTDTTLRNLRMANISITGNIGRDPELRQAGTSQVLKFSVADSEYIYKDGSPSQWYSVEVWGKSAGRLAGLAKHQGHRLRQLVQRPYTNKLNEERLWKSRTAGFPSTKVEAAPASDDLRLSPF